MTEEISMNRAHKEALLLLRIVDRICVKRQMRYTITANTLLYYVYSLPFSESGPAVCIALLYSDFCILKKQLLKYCEENQDYSLHDHANTEHFETLDVWFVKHSRVRLEGDRCREEFYYGTKLILTPLFYAGATKDEWLDTYKAYRLAIGAINARAVLPKKPLLSYIRLTKKRVFSQYLRKRRDRYSLEAIEKELGAKSPSRFILYPYIVGHNERNPNSIPWVVQKASVNATIEVWRTVHRISFAGIACYAVQDTKSVIRCFPQYAIKAIIGKSKSHLLLNGGEDLRRVQLIQLELLIEFDRICRKHRLRYNLGFGTLLGAVRHKGFIPWDDDIDVTMPWQDYDKLDEAMKRELDDTKYYYRTPENEENNHLIFKHLERRGTLYTKPGREKLKHPIGIFIDIFPMYPAAPNAILDWLHARVCRFWRTALWATVGAESEQSTWKRFYYRKIAKFGNKRCYRNFVKAATFFHNHKGRLKFWIAMDRNPYNVALCDEENYNHTIEMEFEGRRFIAPRNYEAVLEYCFGEDWRMYPLVGSRAALHQAVLELGDLYKYESEENTE